MAKEPKKTDKQIEAEAKLAVNEVLRQKRGLAIRNVRPEIRKAFPFGPQATDREKRIWEQVVMQASAEMEKWPPPLAVLLLLVVSCSSAFAEAPEEEAPGEFYPYVLHGNPLHWVRETRLRGLAIAPPQVRNS